MNDNNFYLSELDKYFQKETKKINEDINLNDDQRLKAHKKLKNLISGMINDYHKLNNGKRDATVNDFDNIGYSIEDYTRNPNIEMYPKICYMVVTWDKCFKGKPFFFSCKTIAKKLNKMGMMEYPKGTTKAKQNITTGRKMNYKWCTPSGVRDAIYTLIDMGLVKTHAEMGNNGKQRRIITIQYNKLAELTSLFDYEEINKKYAPRSRERKFAKKTLMISKALADKAREALRERFKNTKDMFFSFINQVSKGYFRFKNNKYLKYYGSQLTINEERYFLDMFGTSTSSKNKTPHEPWVEEYVLNISNEIERLK